MIKERIANLIGVRTIVTFALVGGLLYGFIVGKIDGKDFCEYVAMAIIFFFSKEEKKTIEANNKIIKQEEPKRNKSEGVG